MVCGEAADGASAIEQAKVLRPDAAILDLVMPGINGMEAAAVLKNLMPRMPLIMLTFHEDQINGYLCGFPKVRVRTFSFLSQSRHPEVRAEQRVVQEG